MEELPLFQKLKKLHNCLNKTTDLLTKLGQKPQKCEKRNETPTVKFIESLEIDFDFFEVRPQMIYMNLSKTD